MKIKILRATLVGGEHKDKGEVVDYDGSQLSYLLAKGIAVEFKEEAKEPVKRVSKKA